MVVPNCVNGIVFRTLDVKHFLVMDAVILFIIGLFAFVVLIMGLMGLSVTNKGLPKMRNPPPFPPRQTHVFTQQQIEDALRKKGYGDQFIGYVSEVLQSIEKNEHQELTDQILNEYWKQTQM